MKTYLAVALFLFSLSVQGQVSANEFLASAWDAPEIKALTNQEAYLSNKPYRLAPIRKVAIATESNQLDRTRQDYSFRVLPANPWEMRYTNQYFKTYHDLIGIDRERVLGKLIQQRYEAIITWTYLQEVLSLRQEEKQLTESWITILAAQLNSAFAKPDDYVEARLDLVTRALEVERVKFDIANQQQIIEHLFEKARHKTIDWKSEQLVPVSEIIAKLQTQQVMQANQDIAYRTRQVELANYRYLLEKSNINIGYVQTEYQPFRIEANRRPWNVTVGVTIPLFNPNKGDMAFRKLQILQAEGQLEEAKLEARHAWELGVGRIQSLIDRYNELVAMLAELNAEDLNWKLTAVKENNPAVTVRLKLNLVKIKLAMARLKQEVYQGYIELLAQQDQLQRQPVQNYLLGGN
ncbi:MAG: TolC family protein [Cytophagales bacterium]|nr:TolC family protein [Cytophagales bacterium]